MTMQMREKFYKLGTELHDAKSALVAARRSVGASIADGTVLVDRADIVALEARIADLTAALPVAEQRAKREGEAQRGAEVEAQRTALLAQARKVDRAVCSLEQTFSTLRDLHAGVRGVKGLREALLLNAPRVCDALGVKPRTVAVGDAVVPKPQTMASLWNK